MSLQFYFAAREGEGRQDLCRGRCWPDSQKLVPLAAKQTAASKGTCNRHRAPGTPPHITHSILHTRNITHKKDECRIVICGAVEPVSAFGGAAGARVKVQQRHVTNVCLKKQHDTLRLNRKPQHRPAGVRLVKLPPKMSSGSAFPNHFPAGMQGCCCSAATAILQAPHCAQCVAATGSERLD